MEHNDVLALCDIFAKPVETDGKFVGWSIPRWIHVLLPPHEAVTLPCHWSIDWKEHGL